MMPTNRFLTHSLAAVLPFLILAACSDGERPQSTPLHQGPLPEEAVYIEPGEIFLVGAGIDTFFQSDRGVVHMEDGEPMYGLGLMLDGTGVERLTARALGADGRWTPFQPIEVTWSEDVAHVARLALDGPAVTIEIARNGARIAFAFIERITEPMDTSGTLARDLPLAADNEAVPKNLPGWIITRAQWGSRSRPLCGNLHNPRFLTVHHTATPNNDSLSPAARMRQMQAYHIDALGWCDFGYHYTVGIDGRVYEGRREHRRLGSHVGGHNTNNVGVSVVGNFVSFTPRQVQLDGLVQVSAWLVGQHPIPTTASGIRGHRDWPGHTSNACPGNRLHAWLPTLRSAIAAGGVVPPSCNNACTPGATRCLNDRVERCADFNNDGCTTWGDATDCGCGEDCINGACIRDPEVCCPAAVPDAIERFADVASSSWAAPVAEALADLDITQGCQAEPPFFCPDCRLTRGQAAAFLARALGLDSTIVVTPPTFEDVPTDHTFHSAIEALADAGIVSGCSADPARYCPSDLMTRAQAATVLVRAAALEPVAATTPVFSDVDADSSARPFIETLHRYCHLDGCSSEPLRFCPTNTVTRAAFGLVMLRALNLSPELSGPCCRPTAIEGGDERFVDMTANTPQTRAANALADEGVSSGCRAEPAMFCADCNVSRGQAAALLFRASGLDPSAPEIPTFVDVPPDHRFFEEIESLAAAGRISGCSADPLAFCPDADLTRAQAAALLARSLDMAIDEDAQPDFDDVNPSTWFAGYLAAIDDACIAEPCSQAPRNFCGNEPMKRADFALHIARAWQLGDFENCLEGEAPPSDDPAPSDDTDAADTTDEDDTGSTDGDDSSGDGTDTDDTGDGPPTTDGGTSAGDANDNATSPQDSTTDRDDSAGDAPPADGPGTGDDSPADEGDSATSTSSGGCGCSASHGPPGAPALLLLLAALVSLRRRGDPWHAG